MEQLMQVNFSALTKMVMQVLEQFFSHSALYVNIDRVELEYLPEEDGVITDTSFTLHISFGRHFSDPDKQDLDFDETIELHGYTSDSMEFIKGKLYQIIEQVCFGEG